MKMSFRTRLVIISAGIMLVSFGLCWIMNLFLLPGYYEKTKKVKMNEVYTQVATLFEEKEWDDLSDEDKNKTFDKIDKINAQSGINISIMEVKINVSTELVSDISFLYPNISGRTLEENKTRLTRYVMFKQKGLVFDDNYKLLQRTSNYEMYKVHNDRTELNYVELVGGINGDYWIYLRTNYQAIEESASISNSFLLWVGILAIFICVIIMVFISGQYTKPIVRLTKIARRMEELDFDVKYVGDNKDEVGILGHSMNSLSDKLEHTMSDLKTANNELKHDLKKRSEQEEMRKEFLANVSHELKTPIALIQGYAEGLLDNVNDDSESREFYCEVIIDEAEKMNNMVKKLLSLNQLEFGNEKVQLECFCINDIIDSVLSSQDIKFKQNGINVMFEPEEKFYVWADEYMTEEVVTNYVSNAINHADDEKAIEIKLTDCDGRIRVSVFNTGKKIPDEDIDKIWTKFYKVDKARTREYGGNGIGLSIVKAIVDAHNQQCGVINYDNGVEFWFELDKKDEK